MRLGARRGGALLGSAGAVEEFHRPTLCRELLAFSASETSDLVACPTGIPFDVLCLTKIFLKSFLNPCLKRDHSNFWSYSSIKELNHLKAIEGRLKAALGAVKLLLAFETAKHTDYIGSEHLSMLLNC